MPEDRHYPVRSRKRGKRVQKRKAGIVTPVILVTAVAAAAFMAGRASAEPELIKESEAPRVIAVTEPVELLNIAETWEWEDPEEPEKIEQALVEQGYFRDDIPLSYENQDFLHTACQESGVPYALALAVIQKETGFRNVVGDDGASMGFMQVQEKWHWDRMERLGVKDLNHPFGNFRVGCDFLAELLDRYTVEEALTAYNRGTPGQNEYSRRVMENYEAWKELVGDDVGGIKG